MFSRVIRTVPQRFVRHNSHTAYEEPLRAGLGPGALLAIGGIAAVNLLLFTRPAKDEKAEHGATEQKAHGGLQEGAFTSLEVVKNVRIGNVHNLLRLKLDSKQSSLDYPLGTVIETRALSSCVDETFPFGKLVAGHYVPVSPNSTKGYFDIIYKVYSLEHVQENMLTPLSGMSTHMATLRARDKLEVKPIFRTFESFPEPEEEGVVRHYGLLAGGSGLTPMIQILENMLENSETCVFTLIISDKSEKDVFYEKELYRMSKGHKGRLKVVRTLTRDSPENPTTSVGRLNKELIQLHLPKAPDAIFVSGKDDFVTHVAGHGPLRNAENLGDVKPLANAGGLLKSMGYSSETKIYVL